jgi:nucleoside 2-deoxyribosyltransferase
VKVYISGPITGHADFREKFAAAEDALKQSGFIPVSPVRDDDGTKPWAHYMKLALKDMLDCDAIVLLPGWERSQGAAIEAFVAARCELEFLPYQDVVVPYLEVK